MVCYNSDRPYHINGKPYLRAILVKKKFVVRHWPGIRKHRPTIGLISEIHYHGKAYHDKVISYHNSGIPYLDSDFGKKLNITQIPY